MSKYVCEKCGAQFVTEKQYKKEGSIYMEFIYKCSNILLTTITNQAWKVEWTGECKKRTSLLR
jgi:hypothetical protein